MAVVACDWDDTLVDVKTKEWLPGAKVTLTEWLSTGHRVIVHTCRANWPEGLAEIQQTLAKAHLLHPKLTIVGKPNADVYVDNQAAEFGGDWAATRLTVRGRIAA